tara:strand:- start:149 stop:322 length:174 start_codon:yes stop_codon:yes gene_type:complete
MADGAIIITASASHAPNLGNKFGSLLVFIALLMVLSELTIEIGRNRFVSIHGGDSSC